MWGNICTVIVCLPGCDVIHFKMNVSVLIRPFSYMTKPYSYHNETLKSLVFSGDSFTSLGEGTSLALISQPSSDGATIKIPYGIDVLSHRPGLHLIFSYWSFIVNYIVRSVETGLGRWMLVVAVIIVDAYLFLALSDRTYHLEDTAIGIVWLHCAAW